MKLYVALDAAVVVLLLRRIAMPIIMKTRLLIALSLLSLSLVDVARAVA